MIPSTVSIGRETFFKKTRLLIFALEKNIPDLLVGKEEQIKEISRITGKVPELNNNITQSIREHGYKIPGLQTNPIWDNRDSAKDGVGFYEHQKKRIVREILFSEEDRENTVPQALSSSFTSQNYYISHATGNFYSSKSDMHADHLLPSIQIIDRQLEFVEAINYCPEFANQMSRQYPDYFAQHSGKWHGTRRFFLDYHNCLDNLWLINGGANVGKRSGDTIEFLQKHKYFGERFFRFVAEQGGISQNQILYTVNSIPLAKVARDWFAATYPLTRSLGYSHSASGEILRDTVLSIEQVERGAGNSRAVINNSSREAVLAESLGKALIERSADRTQKRQSSSAGHLSDSDTTDSFDESDMKLADIVASESAPGIMQKASERMHRVKKAQKTDSGPDDDNYQVFNAGL